MYLVHVYRHQSSGRPASNLMPLASLNVILDSLAENIMAALILSLETRNTIAIGLSDLQIILSVSIHSALVHSNITKSIVYEISKHRLLQNWDNQNLTHTTDW